MNKPLVSLIVPVYKTPIILLERFIESALNQTFYEIELILVDDASPDDCPIVLDTVAKKDKRIIVHHRSENGRAGMARGDGLKMAKGKYVLFADADDYLQSDMCEKLVALAEQHSADIVSSSWFVRDQDGKLTEKNILKDRKYDLEKPRDRAKSYQILNYALWNKLFRYETIASLSFEQFEANIGEDILFNIAALCNSKIMVSTSYTGYNYIVHTSSATGRSVKGMPYLRTIRMSGERIRQTIESARNDTVDKKFAERILLKRFSIGCNWIAENPDAQQRDKMWAYWREYLHNSLLPSLKKLYLLATWYKIVSTCQDPGKIYHFTRIATKLTEPMTIFDKTKSLFVSKI